MVADTSWTVLRYFMNEFRIAYEFEFEYDVSSLCSMRPKPKRICQNRSLLFAIPCPAICSAQYEVKQTWKKCIAHIYDGIQLE